MRDLQSDVNVFATTFASPHYVTTPGIGYQCACFDDSQATLFIVDLAGNLLSYVIASDELNLLMPTDYTTVTDCYYDYQIPGLGLVLNGFNVFEFNFNLRMV